jgi:hypothetical protein
MFKAPRFSLILPWNSLFFVFAFYLREWYLGFRPLFRLSALRGRTKCNRGRSRRIRDRIHACLVQLLVQATYQKYDPTNSTEKKSTTSWEGQGSDPRVPRSAFSTSYIREICQKPEDVEFPTNSTEKKGTTSWEAVHVYSYQKYVQVYRKFKSDR